MVRGYTSLREDLDLMKTAMLFCMTTRGVPQVYYGSEVLMTSPAQRDDGRLRGDYPGGWDGDKVDAFTGVGLTQDQTDFKQFLTELLQMRKQNTVFHKGKLIHYVPKDGVYVYFRQDDKHTAMVILNKNQEPYRLETGRFSQFMDGSIIKGLDLLSDKVVDFKEGILLEPRKSYVIKLQ
jgi:glycosidase